MSKTLSEIAQYLKTANKKVQLIYAFNGVGKTRLSREFRQLIAPKNDSDKGDDAGVSESSRTKILYYNAFTEDLFYWDNDLVLGTAPSLKIQPNSFTDWILKDQGQDMNIITNFEHYTNTNIRSEFSNDGSEVRFSIPNTSGKLERIKISKAEESNFIWSVFYTLLDQVISILNVAEPNERETNQFDQLEYIFIDDPVSSLDENHLIQVAVDLAELITSSDSNLKFVITTHSPVFYNVLHNELGLSKNGKKEGCYLLERFDDGSYNLNVKHGDSNTSFSYHLYLKRTLEQAIADDKIEKYHFTLLRNLYEKTASFLGYPRWSELLPDDKVVYFNRVIQFSSHSTLSSTAVAIPSDPEKKMLALLLNHLVTNYRFWK